MAQEIFPMTINGKLETSPDSFDVINPATGQAIARAPECSLAQLDQAVLAAQRAQKAWSKQPIETRKAKVAALAEVLTTNMDMLKRLLTSEQGKPLGDAEGELGFSALWLQSALSLDLPVETLEDTADRRTQTHRVPLGVVGAILPWNYPILLLVWKIVPALVAGNAIVIKPSPYTPLTTLRIGELIAPHLPPGLVNIVSGGDDLGRWLTEHQGIAKISFTGSSATGQRIAASAASTMKRLTLEMGGNDAAIVLADANIEASAQALFWGAMGNSGQVCVAAKRIYVHDQVYDAFKSAFLAVAETVKVGDGTLQGVQLGPVQNKAQFDRVEGIIADSRANGHKVISVGDVPEGGGYFIPVTLVDNPPESSRVVQEEAFGPVVPMLRFTDEADVIARANATDYGLAGSVWSSDLEKAAAIAAQMDCGTVWINTIQDSPIDSPIAGHKHSGLGVENGQAGLLEYTNAQTIVVRK